MNVQIRMLIGTIHIHRDAIGRPANPQCSNFNVCNDEPSIAFAKLVAFDSDNGVQRVANICKACERFIILKQDCHPRLAIFEFSDMSISLVAS